MLHATPYETERRLNRDPRGGARAAGEIMAAHMLDHRERKEEQAKRDRLRRAGASRPMPVPVKPRRKP